MLRCQDFHSNVSFTALIKQCSKRNDEKTEVSFLKTPFTSFYSDVTDLKMKDQVRQENEQEKAMVSLLEQDS